MSAVRKQSYKLLKKTIRLLLWVAPFTLALLFSLNLLFPLQINIPYSQVIKSREGEIMHIFLSEDDKWRVQTSIPEITDNLTKALIAKEDRYFFNHPGINPISIARAFYNNITKGKRTSGASTISMQVIRLLEPRSRTYWNKIIELFRAFQLEWQYSKEEILQLYLNLVPYGGNVEGVKSASYMYFNRPPQQLSLAQIITLTIIPNRPTSLHPGKNDSLLLKERNRWLSYFREEGVFPDSVIQDAELEPLYLAKDKSLSRFRKMSFHLSQRLHEEFPEDPEIQTTIRAKTQTDIERICENYQRRTTPLHIYNAAVVVVDNKTREVIAYVGSPDPTDTLNHGQVDGVRAIRSPGSTLKPCIYGIAFDKGILSPKRKILDLPVDYEGYRPENYDSDYHGNVTVETALAYSLNIPAVNTLNDIGVQSLISTLKEANFQQVGRDENKLGLSLALGGCGVNLEELTGFYAALANLGHFQKLKYRLDIPINKGDTSRILSEQSAFMIEDILSKVERPDLPSDFQYSKNVPKIAWKTGTSYGRKDAWSIGYNANYTVGVWVGNFSGVGIPELTGAGYATPLLFRIFKTLTEADREDQIPIPESLKFRLVCSETGLVPEYFCEHQIRDYFIPMVTEINKCEHMRPIFLSEDRRYAFCRYCIPEYGYVQDLFPEYPPSLLLYYRDRGIAHLEKPPHNPLCTHTSEGEPPRILMPVHGRSYLILNDDTQLGMKAEPPADVLQFSWFVNDRFVGTFPAREEVFFKPSKGRVKISCTDDKGRNSDIAIFVR